MLATSLLRAKLYMLIDTLQRYDNAMVFPGNHDSMTEYEEDFRNGVQELNNLLSCAPGFDPVANKTRPTPYTQGDTIRRQQEDVAACEHEYYRTDMYDVCNKCGNHKYVGVSDVEINAAHYTNSDGNFRFL